MNGLMEMRTTLGAAIVGVALVLLGPSTSMAHCDRENGPVAAAAREALETGNFAAVQVWVGKAQEAEFRARFDECLAVRRAGGKARVLADRYFLETAVRLHREAEGMPYTGLKPARPLPPDLQAAERALEQNDPDTVVSLLTGEVAKKVGEWFSQAAEARKQKDESVKAGRRWVDAYVKYIVYVHGLYQAIQAGPKHGVEG
jgi:hypothetical protein